MFIAEEKLRTEVRAGSAWEFSFSTGLAPEWSLDTDIGARLPETSLDGLLSNVKAGRIYEFVFETGLGGDWMLRGHTSAARTFDFGFETGLPQEWLLRTDAKAMRPLRLSFTTTFDPSRRRLGEERLELYRTGKTDHEALVIPVNWYQKGTERTFSLDLWFSRLQIAEPADDVRLSAFALGGDNRLGQEAVDNGYLEVKTSDQSGYTPLTTGTEFSIGPMWANNKKTLDFKLSMPTSAASVGLVFVGLRLEFLRSVVYGSAPFGRAIFGEFRRKKPETVLVKIHIMS
ncbi:MAG: hypothetical protein ACE5IC_08985 [Candidatus Brocadiales bacterium]